MVRRWEVVAAAALALHCGDEQTDSQLAGRIDAGAAPDAAQGLPDGGGLEDAASGQPDASPGADGGSGADAGFTPPEYGEWIQFEPPDTFCADGSQYKYFVKFTEGADDVVIMFEGGGACWDYLSCTGSARSAANKDGIPDDYADEVGTLATITFGADVLYPLMNDDPAVTPMHDWNKVFLPYCTGDVFAGDAVVTYFDPNGTSDPLEFRHVGHRNVLGVIDQLKVFFPRIDRMFVGGCSAGGAGAINNYYHLRTGLDPSLGFLLNDAGPIFPDEAEGAWSGPLHDRVQETWNLATLIDSGPQADAVRSDLGAINRALAEAFPTDRLAQTYYRLDYNFSLFSYERFYTLDEAGNVVLFNDGSGTSGLGLDERAPEDRSAFYRLWWDDTELLRSVYDAHENLGYFMPFYRQTNDSHCVTLPGAEEFSTFELLTLFFGEFERIAWAESDLPSDGGSVNMRGYVDEMLDVEAPMPSYFEEDGEGPYLACTPDERYFDEDMCRNAP